jgi:ligand-binding SRPBCC domain-containing protein
MLHYKEEIIDGVKKGLMNKGDSVTWRATHFFRSRTLKVHITEIKAPHFFCDEMIQGDFKQMKHEHYFETANNGTQMIDKFHFESPFGIFGKLVNKLFRKLYVPVAKRKK